MARANRRRAGRTLLIVLIVVMVALAAVVFWVRSTPPSQPDLDEGRAMAEAFLNQVRSGQAKEAWDSTTAEFKSAEGRESFVRYVKKHPELSKPLKFVSVQTVQVQGQPRAEYWYTSDAPGSTIKLLAGRDGGTWHVDRLTID